jgi:hypothetical protein
MSDAIRRGLRSSLWMLVAMTGAVPALAAAFDLPATRVAQVTAVFAAITAVVTAAINAAEDRGVIPALLKAPASSGENPVPDDAESGGSQ